MDVEIGDASGLAQEAFPEIVQSTMHGCKAVAMIG